MGLVLGARHDWSLPSLRLPEFSMPHVSLPQARAPSANQNEQTPAAEEIQAWAKANGASELAVPKRIVVIDEVPVLGSGKTDYVVLQRMAAERFAEAKAA
jgi:acyl-coenzyme A synthetase/AMP-(fatty) acid ligase